MGVVVVAAGAGSRMGGSLPKALVRLHGRTLLDRALEAACACPGVVSVVVVAPASHLHEAQEEADRYARPTVRVVAGGDERHDSVAAGLAALDPTVDVVLVHDAARALAPTALFAAVVEAVRAGHPAVVPGLPVVDTIKIVDAQGLVTATPARSTLRAIQTPQGFRRDLLVRAHASAVDPSRGAPPVTDDAGLVEALGERVLVVPGDALAHKVTTPDDLHRAEVALSGMRGPAALTAPSDPYGASDPSAAARPSPSPGASP